MFHPEQCSMGRFSGGSSQSARVGAGFFCLVVLTAPGCFDEADSVGPLECDMVSVSNIRVIPDAPVSESDFEIGWTVFAPCEEFVSFANAPEPANLRVSFDGGLLTAPAELVLAFPYDDLNPCGGVGNVPATVQAGLVADDPNELVPGAYTAAVAIEGEVCDPSGATAEIDFVIQPAGSCPGAATEVLDMQVLDLVFNAETWTVHWTLTYTAEFGEGPIVNPGPEVTPDVVVSIVNAADDVVLASALVAGPEMLPLDSFDQQIALIDVGLPMPPPSGAVGEIHVAISAEVDVLQCGGSGLDLNDEAVIVVTFP